MACNYTTSYNLGCRDSLGGLQVCYIRNFSAGTTWSYDASGIITGGTNITSSFYTTEQAQETGEFMPGEGQHSVENGTNFYNVNVNLTFHKYQASIRDMVYILAQTETEIIVKDQNGKYFLAGEQNGCNVIASNSNSGKAFGDLNGATVNFQAKEPWPAREMSSAFFSTLTVV